MKIIHLEQSSQEWLDWRKNIITATDAAVILYENPYTTRFDLWARKIGIKKEQEENIFMKRGKEDEPVARHLFEERYDIEMTPQCIESSNFHFLGSSLDGMSDCGRYILEIKSNGKKIHESLKKEGIPYFHMIQMQHQILCTDDMCDVCFYASYFQGDIIIIEVRKDEDFAERYLEKAKEFWGRLMTLFPPDFCDKDKISADKKTEIISMIDTLRKKKKEAFELDIFISGLQQNLRSIL